MKRDVNYSHSKNIGEKVGSFCDVPIVQVDMFELDVDVAIDTQRTILANQAMGCSDIPNTAEVLPGEVICSDNMIRRVTTAEVTGHGRYSEGKAYGSEKLADLCTLYAIMGSSENKRGSKGQSAPEELVAWLNAQPKCSFKHEVIVDGDDKIIQTTKAAGVLLFSFRYIGGAAGTYIGGDEVRLLEPVQIKVNPHTTSRVIQYFDNGNETKAVIQPIEYADEFISHYIPTSHVDRITVGGTALFAPEEEA